MRGRILFALIAGVIVIAVAGCDGGATSTTSDVASHAWTARTSTVPTPGAPPSSGANQRTASTRPGRVTRTTHPHCELPGSSEYFRPELNLWRADTAHATTIVCAGGAGSDKLGAGRFLIIRSGAGAREGIDQVTVPGVGPVKITRAPHGAGAAVRAQRDGVIGFRAHNGATGMLHLKNDTVTLNR